jgi:hypothetical protein
MKSIGGLVMAMVLCACGSSSNGGDTAGTGTAGGPDDAAKFVGSWAYASGAKADVTCGTMMFPVALDMVVETFAGGAGKLVKDDSQGCKGLEFAAAGDVATLSPAMQSCAIPAAGMNPAATFAPTSYTFTISADGKTLTAKVAASYTPMGQSACSVSGTNTLTKK